MSWNRASVIGGLMITRHAGEGVSINHGEILLEIVEIKGRAVRIAVKGKPDMLIQRVEPSELLPLRKGSI